MLSVSEAKNVYTCQRVCGVPVIRLLVNLIGLVCVLLDLERDLDIDFTLSALSTLSANSSVNSRVVFEESATCESAPPRKTGPNKIINCGRNFASFSCAPRLSDIFRVLGASQRDFLFDEGHFAPIPPKIPPRQHPGHQHLDVITSVSHAYSCHL